MSTSALKVPQVTTALGTHAIPLANVPAAHAAHVLELRTETRPGGQNTQ